MSEAFKVPIDVGAVLVSIYAALGILTQIVGFVGVCLSTAWAAYRLYDYLKARKVK